MVEYDGAVKKVETPRKIIIIRMMTSPSDWHFRANFDSTFQLASQSQGLSTTIITFEFDRVVVCSSKTMTTTTTSTTITTTTISPILIKLCVPFGI